MSQSSFNQGLLAVTSISAQWKAPHFFWLFDYMIQARRYVICKIEA